MKKITKSAFPPVFNVGNLNGKNGFVLNGIINGDSSGFVSRAGDVNGDGIDDILVGAWGANNNAGQSYVVFGSKSGWPAAINLSSLSGNNGFVINGVKSGDLSGAFASNAGDVNGDGVVDIIIGAHSANNNRGQSYVVFGSKSGWPAAISLDNLNGNNGFAINGINSGDLSGCSVRRAGDVNGDGIDDILIGAYGANNYAGQTFVIFGDKSGWPAAIDLSSLTGNNGFAIYGINSGDSSGASVSTAGDVNGDGIDDILIGAYDANNRAGQSYVVFGDNSGWPSAISLSNLNGRNGFAINGANHLDTSGVSVSRAGDVNGDGIDDILIGAQGVNNSPGQSYVVFGSKSVWPAAISLSNLNGNNGFAIYGINRGDLSGTSVTAAGDVNGDGIDDILIGAPGVNNGSGQSYVVFGSNSVWSAAINLSNLNGNNGFAIDSINSGDWSGFSVSGVGDVNGDGIDDILIGATYAGDKGRPIGQSYVIFGGNPEILTSSPNQFTAVSTPSDPTPPPTAPLNSLPFLSTDALHLLEIIIPTFIGLSCITGIAAYGFYRYKHHDHADLGHGTLVQPLLAEEGGDH